MATASYSFTLPTVGGSNNTWGASLNANWEKIDDLLDGTLDVAGVSITSVKSAATTRTALGLGTSAVVNIDTLLPPGIILMWSGSVASIPAGWALCDGQNGTPDLRNRFVMGAGLSYNPNAYGGAATITDVPAHTHGSGTLATGSAGSHTHTGSTSTTGGHNHTGTTSTGGSHSHEVKQNLADRGGGGLSTGTEVVSSGGSRQANTQSDGSHNHSFTTSTTGAHSHGINVNSNGAHTHSITGSTASTGDASVSVLNPYYALAYIIKTAED